MFLFDLKQFSKITIVREHKRVWVVWPSEITPLLHSFKFFVIFFEQLRTQNIGSIEPSADVMFTAIKRQVEMYTQLQTAQPSRYFEFGVVQRK